MEGREGVGMGTARKRNEQPGLFAQPLRFTPKLTRAGYVVWDNLLNKPFEHRRVVPYFEKWGPAHTKCRKLNEKA